MKGERMVSFSLGSHEISHPSSNTLVARKWVRAHGLGWRILSLSGVRHQRHVAQAHAKYDFRPFWRSTMKLRRYTFRYNKPANNPGRTIRSLCLKKKKVPVSILPLNREHLTRGSAVEVYDHRLRPRPCNPWSLKSAGPTLLFGGRNR